MKYKLEGEEAHDIILAGIRKIYGDIVDASVVTGKEVIHCKMRVEDGALTLTWWVGPS